MSAPKTTSHEFMHNSIVKSLLRDFRDSNLSLRDFLTLTREACQSRMRERLSTWLITIFAFMTASTIAIMLLQGFKISGFALHQELLRYLGIATIGEIAGLLGLVFKASFGERTYLKKRVDRQAVSPAHQPRPLRSAKRKIHAPREFSKA